MKKILSTIMLACCALLVAAQEIDEGIPVNYQGAKPTISDFISAYLTPRYGDDGEQLDENLNVVRDAWYRHLKGQKQREGVTFTLDEKNGFACYEYREVEEGVEFVSRTEMCYWNESDQKHKLFACNTWTFENGKPLLGQYDGIFFCRYDNAKNTMHYVPEPGVDTAYEETAPEAKVSFSLPRTGKDLTIIRWMPSGMKQSQKLKWNGHGF